MERIFGPSKDVLTPGQSIRGSPSDSSISAGETPIGRRNGRSGYTPSKGLSFDGRSKRWNIRDFEIGTVKGRGKYGVVFKARLLCTMETVALKVLDKAELEKDHMSEQLRKEVEIHSRLKHPNIIQLLGYFDDPKRVYLVLEYAAGGELYKHMKKQRHGRFSEAQAAIYIAQLASALSMCHRYNIIHRDVKPENLLLSAKGVLKLADFGWAVHDRRGYHHYQEEEFSSTATRLIGNLGSRRTTMCGTLDYLAPEMVNGKAYDETVDNWTLGVLAYELIVGYPPFESDDDETSILNAKNPVAASVLECENVATFRRIASLRYQCPTFMSEESKDLIKKLLNKDPALRLTLEEVLESPWIKMYVSHLDPWK